MKLCEAFESFDPKKGDIPAGPIYHLQWIAIRARRILSSQNRKEILAQAEVLDWAIDAFFEKQIEEFIEDQLSNNRWARDYLISAKNAGKELKRYVGFELPHDGDFDYHDRSNTTMVEALKECEVHYDLSWPGTTERQPGELYAVLAICLVGHAVKNLQSKNLSNAANLAIDAMDAVCHAEFMGLLGKERTRFFDEERKVRAEKRQFPKKTAETIKEDRKQRARNAALKRHEENHAIKEYAIEYFEANKSAYKSVSDAGRQIAEEVLPAKYRAVERWLSRYLKESTQNRYQDERKEFSDIEEAAEFIAAELCVVKISTVLRWLKEIE